MPMPELNADGHLPTGVHVVSWDEIKERFCRFDRSDRRIDLCERLADYIANARRAGVAALIVDGSFVTSKTAPDDVDLIAIVPQDHDYGAELRPEDYNVLSRARVRRRYRFDLLGSAREGSAALTQWIEFFTQVKGDPSKTKGILRVDL